MMDNFRPNSVILSSVFACLLLAALPCRVQSQNSCVAEATASSGDLGSVADAVANEVAATLTKDINCATGELVDAGPGGNGLGLSVALALAISVADEIGQNCSSQADAQAAELSAKVLGDEVAQALGRVSSPGADRIIEARAAALQNEVTQTAMTQNKAGLAEQIAREIIEAVTNILSALKCESEEPAQGAEGSCFFFGGQFFGDCFTGGQPPPELQPKIAKSERSALGSSVAPSVQGEPARRTGPPTPSQTGNPNCFLFGFQLC